MLGSGLPVWNYKAIQFVTASVGSGCAWERSSCTLRLISTSTETEGQVSQRLKTP